jgi:hypothetical protein
MLSAVMLNVVVLSVVKLNVVMLSVIMLSVMAPNLPFVNEARHYPISSGINRKF